MTVVVRQLNVFPVKSAGGVSVDDVEVLGTGLRHDREFMVIRPDGRHLSQREVPRLALLRPSFDGVKLTFESAPVCEPGLVREVTVHGQVCLGVDQGDDVAEWLGRTLDEDVRLVRFAGVRVLKRGGSMMYGDGEPISVLSVESLDDLNGRLEEPLPMERFRPNIVLAGLGAYGEDAVSRIRVGEVEIELIRPCGRCLIVNTDQDTARRSREPLRTLAKYRTQTFEGSRSIMFGRLGVPSGLGTLRVGEAAVCS
ncbi:MOSC domain-containing protein [Spirillospora sp. NPDC048911]|uniref:MOSC domain-containing protein n=1 Tax=Spirillospora sp. NPDC048911 TaxID=3364527 RepID=UPI003712E4D6